MTPPVSPLLQEAAKVLYEDAPMYRASGEPYPWESLTEHMKAKHVAKVPVSLIRWLLTREPTEAMWRAGRNTEVEYVDEPYPTQGEYGKYVSVNSTRNIYRAMNAALLKEIDHD